MMTLYGAPLGDILSQMKANLDGAITTGRFLASEGETPRAGLISRALRIPARLAARRSTK